MEAIPLTPEDSAILALESDAVAGHTCKVVRLGPGAPSAPALRESISARVAATPALTRRLAGDANRPVWVADEAFALDRHLLDHDRPVDAAGLPGVVARLFEQRLRRDRPLWRMDVVRLTSGETALIWRIHHAVADGTTAMRFAEALLWDPRDPPEPGGRRESTHPAGASHPDEARRRAHLAAFVRREYERSGDPSPFAGEIGARREIAFATVPLRKLHDAAKSLGGATLNDAALTVVAGAIRRWAAAGHRSIGELRAKVPVSLHRPGDGAGNRDSFFSVALPVGEADPGARLREIRAETAGRKAAHDAERIDGLHRRLERVAPRLEERVERAERDPRRFAVNVSNVPGPRTPVQVLGAPVTDLHSIAEIGRGHALRVSVVSCADRLAFSLCVDPEIVRGVETMASGAEAEAAALIRAGSSA